MRNCLLQIWKVLFLIENYVSSGLVFKLPTWKENIYFQFCQAYFVFFTLLSFPNCPPTCWLSPNWRKWNRYPLALDSHQIEDIQVCNSKQICLVLHTYLFTESLEWFKFCEQWKHMANTGRISVLVNYITKICSKINVRNKYGKLLIKAHDSLIRDCKMQIKCVQIRKMSWMKAFPKS